MNMRLRPEQVAEVRHDDAAQRTRQIARREDAVGLHLTQPIRHVGREEQLRDHCRKEDEDDEVVELQRSAQGGQRQRPVVVAVQSRHVFPVSH